ncbi:MAG: cell division protein FtsH, partial [Acidobacteria bacterium]|nr:cell division protein FtsH [Acidobacteriota bacterium]
AVEIDKQTRQLVGAAHARAHTILTGHRPVLDRIAEALLEREVLDGEEVNRIVADFTGGPIEKLKGPQRPARAEA